MIRIKVVKLLQSHGALNIKSVLAVDLETAGAEKKLKIYTTSNWMILCILFFQSRQNRRRKRRRRAECWLSLSPEPGLPWNTNIAHQIFSNMLLQLCMAPGHLYGTDSIIFPPESVCLLKTPCDLEWCISPIIHQSVNATCITIDLLGIYCYAMFAQAQPHMEPETSGVQMHGHGLWGLQVCICVCVCVCVCVVLLAVRCVCVCEGSGESSFYVLLFVQQWYGVRNKRVFVFILLAS